MISPAKNTEGNVLLSDGSEKKTIGGKSLNELSNWLVALYRNAMELSISEFKQAAMLQLSSLIPSQSGIWVTRYREDFVNLAESPLFNLPPESFATYQEAYPNPIESDPVLSAAIRNVGKSQILYDQVIPEDWRQTDMYRIFCIPYEIEHVLCIVRPTEQSQVLHTLSLYQNRCQSGFTENDRELLDFLMPMLAEAQRQNLLSSIGRGSNRHLSIAVCTRDGHLLESDRSFLELTELTLGEVVFPNIDFAALQDRRLEVRIGEHDISMTLEGELWICAINIEMSELTARENEIAQAVRSGMSDKEIAYKLDISTRTVGNILQKIYRKLDINNRYQLIVKLLQDQ